MPRTDEEPGAFLAVTAEPSAWSADLRGPKSAWLARRRKEKVCFVCFTFLAKEVETRTLSLLLMDDCSRWRAGLVTLRWLGTPLIRTPLPLLPREIGFEIGFGGLPAEAARGDSRAKLAAVLGESAS